MRTIILFIIVDDNSVLNYSCCNAQIKFIVAYLKPPFPQCYETSQIFLANKRFCECLRGAVSFFIGLFLRENGILAFWEGALSPAQKALPKSQKDLFSRKPTVKMILMSDARKICEEG